MLLGNNTASVKMYHYAQISCFSSTRTNQGPPFKIKVANASCGSSEAQRIICYLWDALERRPGGLWPTALFPGDDRISTFFFKGDEKTTKCSSEKS